MSALPLASPAPMSDRRFVIVLISTIAAVIGIGVVVVAALGLQDPIYRDFDTGAVEDSSRVLIGMIAVGSVLTLASVGTVIALFRLQLRRRR